MQTSGLSGVRGENELGGISLVSSYHDSVRMGVAMGGHKVPFSGSTLLRSVLRQWAGGGSGEQESATISFSRMRPSFLIFPGILVQWIRGPACCLLGPVS